MRISTQLLSLFSLCLCIFIGTLTAKVNAATANSFSVEIIGQGRPVIMIPGLMSNTEVWRPTAQLLATKYQLHLINIAGFAGNPPITGELLPKVKQELLAYIEQQHLEQPAVIGHSLGAFMAFSLASTAPDKIGTIIAVDGLPFLAPIFTQNVDTSAAMMQQQADYVRQQYQQMNKEQLTAVTSQGLFIHAKSEAHQQQVLKMAIASDAASVGQALYELLTTDLRPEVHKIQSKVLLLGASGALQTQEQQNAARALYQQQIATITNAKLVFNQESRHFIMLDQPDWLNQQIITALQE
ncbi:alpha/beta hydrolase [Rheinheimera sp. MMS21-TC3]|uniref:alpha/beta fold hydrolase n=1 Tax=Rheinheimera sp. MMS21-TC3 TaxID=3072790 RepID=UPI0028C425C9|nr:alpha/beta hydrolase [Rheinheimera sp. MMS21-TC3]WNO61595.1 alpha/beta hydrolase [Rheinheimera sp. MMS21-TC3]